VEEWEAEDLKLLDSVVERLGELMPESLEVLGGHLVDPKKENLCDIAVLSGYLGRRAPEKAVGMLFGAVLPSEEADDLCFIRAFMNIGPVGYEFILKRVGAERDHMRVYYAVMALLAQAQDTDFPARAGLGPKEQWDESLPKSSRGLRRLAREWGEWWAEHQKEYTWDSYKAMLRRK
jgi:hypothetical protein